MHSAHAQEHNLLPLRYFIAWTVHVAIVPNTSCMLRPGHGEWQAFLAIKGGRGYHIVLLPSGKQPCKVGRAERGSEEMDPEDAEEVAAELQGKKMDGWNVLQIAAGTGLTAYIVWAGILMPGFRKVPLKLQVPYIPASAQQVKNVMRLFKGRSGKIVDLGSGDGRIVLEAYKQGFRPAVGYELNPWLLRLSSYRAWKAGCYGKVSYYKEDLWKVNLSDCQNVAVFLAPSVLMLLEKKLLMELPEEARVVAGRFPLPNWTHTDTAGEGVNQAWAYDVKMIRQLKKDELEGSPV